MFRKDAILKVGAYRSFFDGSEDYDLWLRLIDFGDIINLHEPLTVYRTHLSQETRRNRESQLEMDSLTRIFAVSASNIPESSAGENLKSMVIDTKLITSDFLKKSTLSVQDKISLTSAHYLNAAMAELTLANLAKSIYVMAIRPKLFLLALKYTFSRWLHV
jgi:hypothetical protein